MSNNIIQQMLNAKFDKEDIRISFDQQFNLERNGTDFFQTQAKKDVQFYIYEDEIGLERITFTKETKRSLASLIALVYVRGEIGSKFPTHLITVIGARNSSERSTDGKFDCNVIKLTKSESDSIQKHYENYV